MGAALPFASLALGALGTASSVIGQGRQADAQAGQANYLSQVARNNQLAARRNADLALRQGEVDAQRSQLGTAAAIGRQRAALASQGGDVNSGSPLDVAGDTARAGATDTATIRSNAALRAYNYALQADDAGAAAADQDFQAANVRAALPTAIGSSLLGAASTLANRWPR